MDWLTVLNTALTIILTSLCGYITWYLQKKFSDKSATAEALKVLLRKELRELYNEANSRGFVTTDELEEYTKLYEAYHSLGGNGTGTILYNAFSRLPVKEEG